MTTKKILYYCFLLCIGLVGFWLFRNFSTPRTNKIIIVSCVIFALWRIAIGIDDSPNSPHWNQFFERVKYEIKILFQNMEAIGIAAGVLFFMLDIPTDLRNRINQAWDTAHNAYGKNNPARIEALEFLVLNKVPLDTELPLSEKDLSNISIPGVMMRGFDLSRATLRKANLAGADLSKIQLTNADLSHSNLQGVILVDADLTNAVLTGANLRGANLEGANLNGAKFESANLSEANLRFSSLDETSLVNAELQGTQLYQTDLANIEYLEQELVEAQFCKTILPSNFKGNINADRDCQF